MIKHPRQREMWDGLTRSGCFDVVGVILLVGVVLGVILNV
jgi:hypothetical protein